LAFFDSRILKRGGAVSDQKVSVRQLTAARALLGWSRADLAQAAGVSEPAIKRFEASEGPAGGRSETGDKVRAALQEAGIIFFVENEMSPRGGAGVRLKLSHTDEGLRPDQLTSENDG
jgi:transcriptional regulator with XRE-family HTH domain